MFLAYKILRFGVSQAKKKHDKSKLAKSQPHQAWPEPAYYHQHPYQQHHYPPGYPQPQPYPSDYYNNNNNNMHIPMPSTFSSSPPAGGDDTASTSPNEKPSPKTTLKTHLETALRFLQFTLSLTVIGLYGQDIQPSAPTSDPEWVYAVVVGFLSALTAFVIVLCNTVFMKTRPLRCRASVRLPVLVWEGVLVVNWIVVFGVFAGAFLRGHDDKDGDERMRHAVYVDLVCWILFSGSCVLWGVRWWKGRRGSGDGNGNGDGEKGVEM